ncbi:cytochrome aa3 quinol oxidase subunit III, partial [Sporosarcina luteola]|nr:cytochrome aa3 quinol oxidase subunit III [Sporosarcina luteola]
MSHDANTIDSRTHEGELNKLGFWIFLTAEFALFGTLFATLLTLQHGGGYGG